MSRIGAKAVIIPKEATVLINGSNVTVTGPKGELSAVFRSEIKLELSGNEVNVIRATQTPKAKSLHGLYRTIFANMVHGVTQGWSKGLDLVGVGYRASLSGTNLLLNVGFSHQVTFSIPKGILVEVKDNTRITVNGIDKQLVGEVAAQIRRIKSPEPYKGKGIRYIGERIRKKAGKAAKGATAGK